jgi:fimbrial chaperone protein
LPAKKSVQIPIALALSMPVFITPPKARREVSCVIAGVDQGSVGLRCGNSGNAYAQIREIEITRDGQKIARADAGAYILPGAAKTITVKAESALAPGVARVQVTFDDGKTQEFQLSLP